MPESIEISLIEKLGITGGLLVLALIIFRTIWPWYISTYYPNRLAIQQKQADAETRLAAAVEGMSIILADIRRDVITVRIDQARIFAIHNQRPTDPADAASTSSAGAPSSAGALILSSARA